MSCELFHADQGTLRYRQLNDFIPPRYCDPNTSHEMWMVPSDSEPAGLGLGVTAPLAIVPGWNY